MKIPCHVSDFYEIIAKVKLNLKIFQFYELCISGMDWITFIDGLHAQFAGEIET